MRTLLLSALLATAAAGEAPRWAQMDYGPAFGCSLQVGREYVLRALIVRLDRASQTYVAYDQETMRVAALWSGGFIDGKGVIFNGEHHAQPQPQGTIAFANPVGPGWALAGSFSDPRPQVKAAYNVPREGSELTREGQPMPRAWVEPRGYYLHGEEVVLSYAIDGCAVLERAGRTSAGGLVRTIALAASAREQRVDLAAEAQPCALATGADGVALRAVDGRNLVVFAPSPQPREVVVVIGAGSPPAAGALAQATHGGPARWAQAVTTSGTLGSGDGAHVVDTLSLPEDNPWRAWMRIGGFDFAADGRSAALCTWSGDVWVVGGIDAELKHLTWRRYASGLHQPLGLKIVGDAILCTCRDRIVRLHDLDHDGEADFYESFNSDMHLTRHFHEFALDLQSDAAGNLYFAKGCTPGRGGPDFDLWSLHNGCFFKLSPDGRQLEVVARGLRAPNGIGVGPHGELTSGDNQGSWVPVCPINRIRQGAFVGVPAGVPGAVKPDRRDPPIAWLPMDVDNSSGCQVWVPDGCWGPLAGHMLHLSYGKSSLFGVMTQETGGVMQGAVTRFPLNFASGIMRARFNAADGQLYVAGLRGWQTNGARDGAFQRVRSTGKAVAMASGYAVTHDGIALTYSQPLAKAEAENPDNWDLQQFNVVWSSNYGSPEVSPADPSKHGRDHVAVAKATLSADGRTVTLAVPGIRPVHCLVIRPRIATADGTPITAQVNATINVVP